MNCNDCNMAGIFETDLLLVYKKYQLARALGVPRLLADDVRLRMNAPHLATCNSKSQNKFALSGANPAREGHMCAAACVRSNATHF